jgi:hypothetical protein
MIDGALCDCIDDANAIQIISALDAYEQRTDNGSIPFDIALSTFAAISFLSFV